MSFISFVVVVVVVVVLVVVVVDYCCFNVFFTVQIVVDVATLSSLNCY